MKNLLFDIIFRPAANIVTTKTHESSLKSKQNLSFHIIYACDVDEIFVDSHFDFLNPSLRLHYMLLFLFLFLFESSRNGSHAAYYIYT